MANQRPRISPRFKVDDRIEIKTAMHLSLTGKHGVITEIHPSRHSHTLDLYDVRLDGETREATVWDIEIESEEANAG